MNRYLMVLVAIVAFFCVPFVGCNGAPPECDAATPCTGFGETCVAGECLAGSCATSAQCSMEHYCDGRSCQPGCEQPSDCYPGFTCNSELQVCEEDGCDNTSVDCGYREFCNVATGDCYDAGGKYCSFCDEDAECGDGNLCLAHYCGVDCSGGRECPSGFECYGFPDEFGNVAAYQCFTYCWLYEDYEPDSFAREPVTPEGITITQARARKAGAYVGSK